MNKYWIYQKQLFFVVNSSAEIVACNPAAAAIMGYKNSSQAIGMDYSQQQCDAKYFANDFILQDSMVLDTGEDLNFIANHKYSDSKYHCYLANKSMIIDNDEKLIAQTYFDVSQFINPFLCELFSLTHGDNQIQDNKSFWYPFSKQRDKKSIFTQREKDCIRYLFRCYSNRMIARSLQISVRTVETYIEHIIKKLGVISKYEIIRACLHKNLIEPSWLC